MTFHKNISWLELNGFFQDKDHIHYKFWKSLEVYDLFQLLREAPFIPVQRFKPKIIHIKAKIDGCDSQL